MTKKFKRFFQIGASIILVVLSIAFASANLEKVKISYLFGSAELYVCVLVFIALVLGGGIGAIFRIPAYHRLRRENSRLQKKLKGANESQESSDDGLRAITYQKQA